MADTIPPLAAGMLERADAQFGNQYSAVLYGSWVRGDVLEGRSDVNLLLVTERLTPDQLRGLAPALQAFEAERMAPPMIFTAAEWRRAGDSFPIEITDMKLACRVLRGSDPVAGLTIQPGDLRRALESEFRGKLLRLRVDLGLYATRPELLAAVVGHSAGSFRVLFRGLLVMGGGSVPSGDDALAQAAGRLAGFDPAPLAQVLSRRRQTEWRCEAALYEGFLAVVEQAIRYIDTVHPGVH
jgi:hypothetical protein